MKMTTTMGTAGAVGSALEHFGGEIRRFFEAMAAGTQASRDYTRLSQASDLALEREGLARDGIAGAVMERHFR